MTLKNLIAKSAGHLHQIGNTRNNRSGKLPISPMVTVILGDKTLNNTSIIVEEFEDNHPSVADDMVFISVSDRGDKIGLFDPQSQKYVVTTFDDVKKHLIQTCYGVGTSFSDLGQIFISFILPTEIITSDETYQNWLDIIPDVKEKIKPKKDIHIKSSLFLLIDEDAPRHDIKETLKNFGDTDFVTDTVYLLPRELSNGVIVSDYSLHYQAIAAILTLINDIKNYYLHNKVVTVGYQRVVKPNVEISQIIVSYLIDKIYSQIWLNQVREEDIVSKCHNVISELIKGLSFSTPNTSLIDSLPRRYMDREIRLEEETAEDIDKLTMGTFSLFIKQYAQNEFKEVALGSSYISDQIQKLPPREIIELSTIDYLGQLFEIDSPTMSLKGEDYIDKVIEKELRILLKKDTIVGINDAVSNMSLLKKEYEDLLNKRLLLRKIKDTGLEQFYNEQLDKYWEDNKYRIISKIESIRDIETLNSELENVVTELDKYIPILQLSFEEELSQRFGVVGNRPQDIYDLINKKFLKNTVPFYKTNTVLSTVIMLNDSRVRGSLSDYLSNNKFQLYDTANPNALEAVTFYQVDTKSLWD